MVTRTNRDALLIQDGTYIMGMRLGHDERENSNLVLCGTDQTQSLNRGQRLGSIIQQFPLMEGDAV